MAGNSPVYEELNRKWKSTCRVLLGEEIGELSEYREYLCELGYSEPLIHRKSSVSGKEITYATPHYCKGAKWVGLSEVDFQKKFEALSINEVKDIDSIVSAVQERAYYCGDVILGNSKFIEKSSNVSDSFYVYECGKVSDTKYAAYSDWPKMCECVFGSSAPGESSFLIRCNDTFRDKRCFELWGSLNSSDCYYVMGLNSCSNCFFCFNARGIKNAVGNLELPADKFSILKEKLLGEIREKLKKDKKLPSVAQIMGRCKDYSGEVKELLKGRVEYEEKSTDMKPIENAFSKTCEVVLGKKLGGLANYSGWLEGHSKGLRTCRSVASGKPVYQGCYAHYSDIPQDRLLVEKEALELLKVSKLEEKDVLGINLENAHEIIGKIAYVSIDYHDGTNVNIIECPTYGYSSHVLRTFPVVYTKYTAYTFWARSSEYVFGGGQLFDSNFCMNCYNSNRLQRCLEVDSSRDCSDLYFSHNCENVRDSMFCFNAKNLQNAVGNAQLGKEKYAPLKEKIVGEMRAELEKGKKLQWDIFNIGCAGKQ
ncbi:Uncharacterised protein [Candidatus Anstonella stagnisolia]|nr:Uncharacterised protein [Candidatus Anstonella stagnisolia]